MSAGYLMRSKRKARGLESVTLILMRAPFVEGLLGFALIATSLIAGASEIRSGPCDRPESIAMIEPCRTRGFAAAGEITRRPASEGARPAVRGTVESGPAEEPIHFDEHQMPVLSDLQRRELESDFQKGLERYARTREGKAMIAKYGRPGSIDIRIRLAPNDEGILGSAAPASNNLAAAVGAAPFVYVVTINSSLEGVEIRDAKPIGYVYPANTTDLRALQIGAEILHVDFFVEGSRAGTHHENEEFQARWSAFVRELGYPGFPHHD